MQTGMTDERDLSKVQNTTKEMLRLLCNGRGYSNLTEVQRAGVYLLCRELSSLCHDKLPHKFQNLAYILGAIDADDIKKVLMEGLNEIS
ncbi:MAG: hypothetical protein ABFD79_14730 [Phycisphaerales bacterium]